MSGWSKFSAWVGGLAVVSVLPVIVASGSLPDPVASHWGAEGVPDGSLPSWSLYLTALGLVAVGALLSLIFRADGKPTPEATAISGLVGGVALSITTISVVLNWGVDDWTQAGSFHWWHVLVVLVSGFGVAAIGYALGKRWFPVPRREPLSVPTDASPISEDAVWSNTISVRWVAFLLLPFAAVFLFLPGWLKLIAILYVVLTVLFSKIAVTVDSAGLRVSLAGALTVKRIALEDIESVSAIDLEPREWAGWGYRVVPNGSAVVLRKGPAIQVVRTSGRRFAVTIDDAETGAAVLAGHLARINV